VIDIMNTPEQYVLFGLISIIVIIIVIAYMWSKVQRRRVQDAMEDIDSRPDNRRKRSREMLDRLIETKQQIAQNQTIVQRKVQCRLHSKYLIKLGLHIWKFWNGIPRYIQVWGLSFLMNIFIL